MAQQIEVLVDDNDYVMLVNRKTNKYHLRFNPSTRIVNVCVEHLREGGGRPLSELVDLDEFIHLHDID